VLLGAGLMRVLQDELDGVGQLVRLQRGVQPGPVKNPAL
jgi:hypothetical protein